ncbi:MAG: IS481 family transposase, partial [Christensenellales bacterium]
MNSITQNKRYCPHNLKNKLQSVITYRHCKDIDYVCRKYHISKASLMRWNKKYDGTPQSLENKSHKPLTPHPNSHTETELTWIKNLHRRNPNISVCEMYGKLRTEYGYSRHFGSLYRVFVRLGYRKQVKSTKKVYVPKPYNTPTCIGVKWQMDVKHIPKVCYSGNDGQKFYQYTMIDEASRERFIYPYMEQSSYSTVD